VRLFGPAPFSEVNHFQEKSVAMVKDPFSRMLASRYYRVWDIFNFMTTMDLDFKKICIGVCKKKKDTHPRGYMSKYILWVTFLKTHIFQL